MNNESPTKPVFDEQASSDRPLSVYIPMPDGVNIAVDIWLPENYRSGLQVPVAVSFTRYWRVAEGCEPESRIMPLTQSGIAVAIVDCRGTGASFGSRNVEMSGAEVADFSTVIEWLARQPWSNGAVVSIGVSYCANTAELAMIDAPSALKAAIPLFSDFDVYAHNSFPGGLLNSGLLKPWSDGVKAMDLNETEDIGPLWKNYRGKSIKPVSDDKQRLAQALQEHRENVSLSDYLATIECRDDFNFADSLDDKDRFVSPHLMQNNQRLREVPSYHWASFTDAGTAAGAIARFLSSTAPMRVVIGYWTHGAEFGTDPFKPMGHNASPAVKDQWQHIADYIKKLCDDEEHDSVSNTCINPGPSSERALYYYTAGEERWKKTQTWPPTYVHTQSWFLNENNSLSLEEPSGSATSDSYPVNFNAGTGAYPRWDQIMKEVHYGDRAIEDKKLLIYTSPPLDQAIEITGHPVMHLQLSSTQTDGAVIVYLEAVAPDGEVMMLTEGGLRLIHRNVSHDTPPYTQFGAYHSFDSKDALAMPVAEKVNVVIECLPLSVQIPKGYALRVAIAGHDEDCFDRLPAEGEVTLSVFRHANALSFIELPVSYLATSGSQKSADYKSPFQPEQAENLVSFQ